MLRSLVCAAIVLAACSDPPARPTEGLPTGGVRVQVRLGDVAVSDPDGFILLAPDSSYPIPAAGGAVLFDSIPADSLFTVSLDGLTGSCWVALATRSILVIADSMVDLTFVVNCPAPLGFLEVVTVTTGVDLPDQGHLIVHDGVGEPIGVNDTMYLSGPPGTPVDLNLLGGTAGCWPGDSLVRHLRYPPSGAVTRVSFGVACGAVAISLYRRGQAWPLVLLNLDGRSQPLPQTDLTPIDLSWSPDGAELLMVGADRRLMRLDRRSGATRLYFDGTSTWGTGVSWAPTGGSAIVGALVPNDYSYLYTLDLISGARTRLPGDQRDEMEPSISPDGTAVAFIGNVGGQALLEVARLDGSMRHTVADSAEFASPAWTPDGKSLVFTRDVPGGPSGPQYHSRIWKVGVDGTGLTQLTFADYPEVDVNPALSRDGTTILFTRAREDIILFKLMRIPITGGAPAVVTSVVAGQPFGPAAFIP